jgi:hypothetical protein
MSTGAPQRSHSGHPVRIIRIYAQQISPSIPEVLKNDGNCVEVLSFVVGMVLVHDRIRDGHINVPWEQFHYLHHEEMINTCVECHFVESAECIESGPHQQEEISSTTPEEEISVVNRKPDIPNTSPPPPRRSLQLNESSAPMAVCWMISESDSELSSLGVPGTGFQKVLSFHVQFPEESQSHFSAGTSSATRNARIYGEYDYCLSRPYWHSDSNILPLNSDKGPADLRNGLKTWPFNVFASSAYRASQTTNGRTLVPGLQTGHISQRRVEISIESTIRVFMCDTVWPIFRAFETASFGPLLHIWEELRRSVEERFGLHPLSAARRRNGRRTRGRISCQ